MRLHLHLLNLCRPAVQLSQRHCPPPLPKGPGGAPRIYSTESVLLIALLRTLWRLDYQEMHDWLVACPALALACGLPVGREGQVRVLNPSQMGKRAPRAGAPPRIVRLDAAYWGVTLITWSTPRSMRWPSSLSTPSAQSPDRVSRQRGPP